MRKYFAAALLAGSLAAPAFIQDVAPFSGLRVEGIVGYDTTDVEGESADGLLYGVGAGYDIQSGGLVFGVDGEINKSNSTNASAAASSPATSSAPAPAAISMPASESVPQSGRTCWSMFAAAIPMPG